MDLLLRRRYKPLNGPAYPNRRCRRLSLELLESRNLLSFRPAEFYPLGGGPQSLLALSLRDDEVFDLVSNTLFDNTVNVLYGNGDGTFQPRVQYSAGGNGPLGLVAGEFRSGSSTPDLVWSNYYSGTVGIMFNQGDGSFQGPVTAAKGFTSPHLLGAGEFRSGSGLLDLAVTNYNRRAVSVLLGNGDGSFQSAVHYSTPSETRQVKAGNLRNSGVLDLVVTPTSGTTIMVLLGNGDGTFQEPVTYPAGDASNVAIAEFRTGSGILDLAVSSRLSNTLAILLGNGDGTFQPPEYYSVGVSSFYPDVETGDFNQDGNLDVVTTDFGTNTISVLLGRGDGGFGTVMTFRVGVAPDKVAVADFDANGYPDLAVNNFGSNELAVLLNDGMWGSGPGSSPGGSNLMNAATLAVDGTVVVGLLSVEGNYTQTATGNLRIDLGGTSPGIDHDFLDIRLEAGFAGTATLDGTLTIRLLDGYLPVPDDFFVPFCAEGGITGDFAAFDGLLLSEMLALIPFHDGTCYYLWAYAF